MTTAVDAGGLFARTFLAGTAEVAAEVTAEPSAEVDAEASAEGAAEVTAEASAGVTAEPTAEVAAEVAAEAGPGGWTLKGLLSVFSPLEWEGSAGTEGISGPDFGTPVRA